MRETLKLIRVIATRRATTRDLTRTVRVSRATIFRLLAACERELGVRIECEGGVFSLQDWGLLNQRKVLSWVAAVR
jgi:DNA-binding IclR family transcriptional regulator